MADNALHSWICPHCGTIVDRALTTPHNCPARPVEMTAGQMLAGILTELRTIRRMLEYKWNMRGPRND